MACEVIENTFKHVQRKQELKLGCVLVELDILLVVAFILIKSFLVHQIIGASYRRINLTCSKHFFDFICFENQKLQGIQWVLQHEPKCHWTLVPSLFKRVDQLCEYEHFLIG